MKFKKMFVFALLLGFCLSGCGKRIVVHVPVTPGMTKSDVRIAEKIAIEESKQAEIRARWEAQQKRLKKSLNLKCSNKNDEESVVIEEGLIRDAFRVSGNRAARFFLARYMALVLVLNPYNETADIDEGGRLMVSNMCPNGKITLPAVLGWDAGILGGRNGGYTAEDFVWTATRSVNGHFYYGISQYVSLYVYQWQRERKAQWIMSLEDIDRLLPKHVGSR